MASAVEEDDGLVEGAVVTRILLEEIKKALGGLVSILLLDSEGGEGEEGGREEERGGREKRRGERGEEKRKEESE